MLGSTGSIWPTIDWVVQYLDSNVSLWSNNLPLLYMCKSGFVWDFNFIQCTSSQRLRVPRTRTVWQKREGWMWIPEYPLRDTSQLSPSILIPDQMSTIISTRSAMCPWWIYTCQRRDLRERPCRNSCNPFLLEGSSVLKVVKWPKYEKNLPLYRSKH